MEGHVDTSALFCSLVAFDTKNMVNTSVFTLLWCIQRHRTLGNSCGAAWINFASSTSCSNQAKFSTCPPLCVFLSFPLSCAFSERPWILLQNVKHCLLFIGFAISPLGFCLFLPGKVEDCRDTVDGRILHQLIGRIVYPIIQKALFITGGAGFLPSTVCHRSVERKPDEYDLVGDGGSIPEGNGLRSGATEEI